MKFDVFKFVQNNKTLFSGFMTGKELIKSEIQVHTWQPMVSMRGYQREKSKQKISKITKFLNQSKGIMPSSILICSRESNIKFSLKKGNFGTLFIPNKSNLYVVDGQHRIEGLISAIRDNKKIDNYVLPVIFLCPKLWNSQLNPFIEEGKQFITINKTQTRVKGDLVDSFLLTLDKHNKQTNLNALDDLPEDISKNMKIRVKALDIAIILNAIDKGPWHSKIRRTNQKRSSTTLVSQIAMTDSLIVIIKDSQYDKIFTGTLAKCLNKYWIALLQNYPNAKKNPKEYFLQKRLGLVVFNSIFPKVDALTTSKTIKEYNHVLTKYAKMKPESFWSKTGGAKSLGTSHASTKQLSEEIWK